MGVPIEETAVALHGLKIQGVTIRRGAAGRWQVRIKIAGVVIIDGLRTIHVDREFGTSERQTGSKPVGPHKKGNPPCPKS